MTGEYVEVSRPERLACTWSWEGDPPEQAGSRDTLVTVEFHEDGHARASYSRTAASPALR